MNQEIMLVQSDMEMGSLNYGTSRLEFLRPLELKEGDEFYVDHISPGYTKQEKREDGTIETLIMDMEVCLLIKRHEGKKFNKKYIYAKPIIDS
jgi:hypothetical protein